MIIRIGLLKCGQKHMVFSRERKALVELISMFKELLGIEGKQYWQCHSQPCEISPFPKHTLFMLFK